MEYTNNRTDHDYMDNLKINKKVCHISTVHALFDTRIFSKECLTLKRAGYEVSIVTTDNVCEDIDGFQVRVLPKPKNRFERMTRTVCQAYNLAINEDAALYHIHDPELLPLAQFLRFRGKRVIYDMHENVPKSIKTKPWLKPLFRKIIAAVYEILERFILFGVPVIFAENSYEKNYPGVYKHATVLNFPIINELIKLSNSKYSVPTLGYIGGVTKARGLTVTLEALRQLHSDRQFANVQWECIGTIDDRYSADIISASKLLGNGTMRFRGRMKSFEGLSIISKCHVGLALLQPLPNYIESYPTKMFEYMALGLPVIVSHFPLYREIVESNNCGICVNPAAPEEIVNAVKWLIRNPEEAGEMGKRGQRAVCEKYNWDMEAGKLLAFYKEVGMPTAELFGCHV